MSNAVYPVLPGLAHGQMRTVLPPPVTIRTTPARREYRARDAQLPRYAYTLPYEFLRSSAARLELQTLVGFYNARGGPFESFLFTDGADNTAATALFGTGDGSTTDWQLVRPFGGFAEPVRSPNGAPAIYVAGVLKTAVTHYTVSATGLVSFVTAPSVGQALTWSGSFYRRVRFDGDRLDITQFLRTLWEAKRVQLISTEN